MASSKQAAWEKIKAAVADAAEEFGPVAGEWAERARSAAVDGWDATAEGVRTGAAYTADAARAGAHAVGRGVAAAEDKVESVANGVVAGAIAGAMAAWVMNQFQAANAKKGGDHQAGGAESAAAEAGGTARTAAAEGSDGNATVQVAQKVSREQFGHELKDAEKALAGLAVHYGYGAAMGALYGGLAEVVPVVGTGLGIPYATALWLFGDEIATTYLGIAKPPAATTPAEHASTLSAHFVYGVTLDIARRVLRHIV